MIHDQYKTRSCFLLVDETGIQCGFNRENRLGVTCAVDCISICLGILFLRSSFMITIASCLSRTATDKHKDCSVIMWRCDDVGEAILFPEMSNRSFCVCLFGAVEVPA